MLTPCQAPSASVAPWRYHPALRHATADAGVSKRKRWPGWVCLRDESIRDGPVRADRAAQRPRCSTGDAPGHGPRRVPSGGRRCTGCRWGGRSAPVRAVRADDAGPSPSCAVKRTSAGRMSAPRSEPGCGRAGGRVCGGVARQLEASQLVTPHHVPEECSKGVILAEDEFIRLRGGMFRHDREWARSPGLVEGEAREDEELAVAVGAQVGRRCRGCHRRAPQICYPSVASVRYIPRVAVPRGVCRHGTCGETPWQRDRSE